MKKGKCDIPVPCEETARMKLSAYTMRVYTMQHDVHFPSRRVSPSPTAHNCVNEGHLRNVDTRTILLQHTTARLVRDRERLAYTTPTDTCCF